MGFVNEYVPEEDVKKYNLAVIDKYYFKGHCKPDWTRDKDRNIYLRHMRSGKEEAVVEDTFTFFWNSTLVEVWLTFVLNENKAPNTTIWALRGMDAPWWEKDQEIRAATQLMLQENMIEITADLKVALIVYQSLGLHSPVTNLNITFEF